MSAFGARARRVRDEGVPLPGDGPTCRRGRNAAGRRDGRRAARRARRRRVGVEVHPSRQQQEPRRAAHRTRGRRTTCRRRQLRRARPVGLVASATVVRRRRCCCGSRPASMRTPTSTSRPVRTTRSSASTSPTVTRCVPSSEQPRRISPTGGLHCHIGSNVFAVDSFRRAAATMAGFAAPLDLPELVAGWRARGGVCGGRNRADHHGVGRSGARGQPAAGVRSEVSVEPGRAIVAGAAITVYTVGTIKRIPGVRTYIAVDGGHERQPTAGAVRQRIRGVPATSGRRRPAAPRGSSASTASRATSCCSTPTCRPMSPWGTCWPCRSPAPTATRWAPTTTRSRDRRSSSCGRDCPSRRATRDVRRPLGHGRRLTARRDER